MHEEREQLRIEVEENRMQAIDGLEQVVQALMRLNELGVRVGAAGLPPLNPQFLAKAPMQIQYARAGQLLAFPSETLEVWQFSSPALDPGEGE